MSTGRTRQIYSSMQLTCLLLVLGIFGIHIICCHGQIDPLALGRADPQCWESSTAILLEMKKPRIADSVSGFWDFMIFLKSSDNYKHGVLFWDLAQLFWDIYVDCVLSRTHGLGRRQLKEGGKKTTNLISQLIPMALEQWDSRKKPTVGTSHNSATPTAPGIDLTGANGTAHWSPSGTLTQNRRPLQTNQKEFIEELIGIHLNKSESEFLANIQRGMKKIGEGQSGKK